MSKIVPKHIGFVIDGNRRWAKEHGLPYYEGHMAGYNALKDVVQATFEAGVEYVSIYIFSTENWKRSEDEVKRLMKLILKLITTDLKIFQEENLRLRILGTKDGLKKEIISAVENAEAVTRNNTKGTVALCFNYGGQLELVDAVKKIVQSGKKVNEIDEKLIADNLYAPEVPPLDMLVRTSGEKRTSNFMLWRSAYSEMLFLDKHWPDMTKQDVKVILKEYTKRQRRFGG